MTVQITDRVRYLDESFELIWDTYLVPYIREHYKLDLLIGGFTTVCHRGYVAEYEIRDAMLYLCSLQIFAMVRPYPLIAGVVGEEIFYKTKSRKQEAIDSGWVKFNPLQERIDVSGYLVLGQGMKGYEDYMDFSSLYPHVCEKLLGITLINGQSKQVEDFSKEAEQIRNQITKPMGADEDENKLIREFSRKVIKLNR